MKMGAYHTIDLQLNQKFTLTKECWDSIALDRLGEGCGFRWSNDKFISSFSCLDVACDPTRTADVAAVVMQEGEFTRITIIK